MRAGESGVSGVAPCTPALATERVGVSMGGGSDWGPANHCSGEQVRYDCSGAFHKVGGAGAAAEQKQYGRGACICHAINTRVLI